MIVYVDGSSNGRYCFLAGTGVHPNAFFRLNHEIRYKKGITNNEAEYLAVLLALQSLPGGMTIYSDSQLVVKQLNHEWNIKEERLRRLATKVWRLSRGRKIKFKWIPREENKAGKYLG